MASEANRTRLLKAVENIKQRSQLVEVALNLDLAIAYNQPPRLKLKDEDWEWVRSLI